MLLNVVVLVLLARCSIECRRDSIIDGYIQCGLIESKEEEYKTMFNVVVLKASHKTIQNVLKALVLQPNYISYSYKEKRSYIMGGEPKQSYDRSGSGDRLKTFGETTQKNLVNWKLITRGEFIQFLHNIFHGWSLV